MFSQCLLVTARSSLLRTCSHTGDIGINTKILIKEPTAAFLVHCKQNTMISAASHLHFSSPLALSLVVPPFCFQLWWCIYNIYCHAVKRLCKQQPQRNTRANSLSILLKISGICVWKQLEFHTIKPLLATSEGAPWWIKGYFKVEIG